jgi:hypothetical protein
MFVDHRADANPTCFDGSFRETNALLYQRQTLLDPSFRLWFVEPHFGIWPQVLRLRA